MIRIFKTTTRKYVFSFDEIAPVRKEANTWGVYQFRFVFPCVNEIKKSTRSFRLLENYFSLHKSLHQWIKQRHRYYWYAPEILLIKIQEEKENGKDETAAHQRGTWVKSDIFAQGLVFGIVFYFGLFSSHSLCVRSFKVGRNVIWWNRNEKITLWVCNSQFSNLKSVRSKTRMVLDVAKVGWFSR